MNTLVDFDRLRSFTDGDPALEAELLGLFVETAAGYLSGLEGALAEPARWRAVAHGLKGASSNIGATAIAELAGAAERAPPDAARLGTLRAAFAATRLSVDAHLGCAAVDGGMGSPRGSAASLTQPLSGYTE